MLSCLVAMHSVNSEIFKIQGFFFFVMLVKIFDCGTGMNLDNIFLMVTVSHQSTVLIRESS